MKMGEEKQQPSQKKLQQRPWFWPAIYSLIALAVVAVILSYNALYESQQDDLLMNEPGAPDPVLMETATRAETMQYPFKEEYVEAVTVLQGFYDMEADAEKRGNALLVFNQVYSTSTGISLAINSEPFEVVAAMSGEVAEVKLDVFTGNEITINHSDGMQTRYSSVTDILIKEGDIVTQGESIATAMENESNPTAGIHLHFEVLEQGVPVNPENLLAF